MALGVLELGHLAVEVRRDRQRCPIGSGGGEEDQVGLVPPGPGPVRDHVVEATEDVGHVDRGAAVQGGDEGERRAGGPASAGEHGASGLARERRADHVARSTVEHRWGGALGHHLLEADRGDLEQRHGRPGRRSVRGGGRREGGLELGDAIALVPGEQGGGDPGEVGGDQDPGDCDGGDRLQGPAAEAPPRGRWHP